jgi:hypothetical protein
MPDTAPDKTPEDFSEAADKSVGAGIADETAAYDRAIADDDDTAQDKE